MIGKSSKPFIRRRVRKNPLPNLDKSLAKILRQIEEGSLTSIFASKKSLKGLSRNSSNRRSKYIGVSKNSKNWQVLCKLEDMKKYVGTYASQEEAAIVSDFYSIAYCGTRAVTNFNYDSGIILEMIQSYYKNENYFRPELFLTQILG